MIRIAKTALTIMALLFVRGALAALIGIGSDGNLYSVSESTATLTLIGNAGNAGAWADITFAPGGTLYGFTDSAATPTLYTLNPATAATTAIGPLNAGAFVFEGALTISPGGTAYAMNGGRNSNAQLFTLNLTTGAATSLGVVTGATDVNGFVYRSDGKLVGLDDNTNSLIVIDPGTLTATTLAATPTTVGPIGGLTIDNGVGYYATTVNAASGGDLYSFDLFTGASTLIGSLGGESGAALAGLAAPQTVPEPASLALLGVAFAALGLARLRKPS
jgi:PEP-CTERM motif